MQESGYNIIVQYKYRIMRISVLVEIEFDTVPRYIKYIFGTSTENLISIIISLLNCLIDIFL